MSKRKVTQYTEDFKRSSAKLAVNTDQPIAQTAKELGVNASTLHGWVKSYEPHAISNDKSSSTVSSSLEEELKQLKKENARLKQERDILKKATAYFAESIL